MNQGYPMVLIYEFNAEGGRASSEDQVALGRFLRLKNGRVHSSSESNFV